MPLNNHHPADNTSGPLDKVTVTREIDAAAGDIFDILSNPDRHRETDSTGGVQASDKGQRLQQVGDTFRMNMTRPDGSEYQTDNEVFALVENRVIGWTNKRNVTNDVVVGAKWLYELEPVDAGHTTVTLTYDPTEIDDPAVQKVARNFADADKLEASLARLAEAVA